MFDIVGISIFQMRYFHDVLEENRNVMIFLLYVGDIINIKNNTELIQGTTPKLNTALVFKYLGDLGYFLGILSVNN